MIKSWIFGLMRQRANALTAASFGIALAVALLAALGLFVSNSAGTMTARAVSSIAPDWQIELVGTTDPAGALEQLKDTVTNPVTEQVDYASVSSLTSQTGGTTQTTGAGKVIGISESYFKSFPRQGRLLAGSFDGALLTQQTAANLHAAPGDKVTIARLGQEPVDVTIAGLIEMPSADQFFQVVNGQTQTARTAPPDNVLLLPDAQWVNLFETQLETLPETAHRQLHVSFAHDNLPPDPVAAFVDATGLSNNMLAKLAGEGVIVNNLAARLDGVRQDALFAKVLFLFLGLPGAITALLLTMVLASASQERRRRDVALLQLRGITSNRLNMLMSLEALVIGAVGSVLGLCVAKLIAAWGLTMPSGLERWTWYLAAGILGFAATLLLVAVPVAMTTRKTVAQNIAEVQLDETAKPAWQRLWLDVVFLAIAGFILWQSSTTGYRVVTAPEGVATATVDYKAYLAPGLLWIGAALLLMRLWSLFMMKGAGALSNLVRPVAGRFSGLAAAAMSHDHKRLTKGVVLVALAVSFATATAIFNTTYQQQARVDAALTTGADVAITGTIDAPASTVLPLLDKIPGIANAQPMQHRFAYVGTDLQDLYGIDPAAISKATSMSDAYFTSGDAAATLEQLKTIRDGVLVSDETVTDFQLKPGDKLNLRLRTAKDSAYQVLPFTFIGVVREFPTAPTDSFLVANADYVAKATGITTAETVLIKSAIAPQDLAASIKQALPPSTPLKVSDVSEAAHRIGSSLTAVDLSGLTRLELAFALPLVAGALGLVFALGLEERKRSFAILLALGANARQLGAFLWSEALVIYAAGVIAGFAIGWALAWVLVKLMTHVFDPPPDALAIPWAYLALLALTGFAAMALTVLWHLRKPNEPLSFAIRNG